MKTLLLAAVIVLGWRTAFAQGQYHPVFPQGQINAAASNRFQKPFASGNSENENGIRKSVPTSLVTVLAQMSELKKTGLHMAPHSNLQRASNDTVYVYNDTLVITGNYTHTGPIFVFGNGVLIFKNATVMDTGDIYVFQSGQMYADSSSLTFPQQYFYERGITIINHAYVNIQNCSFNYSGMSHNLVLGDTATMIMNNVHENDWTTCGLFGSPSITIRGCNQGGEYILSEQSTATFNNVDTLILWHQFPAGTVVNYAFPNGDTVYDYAFNNTITGISGIDYSVSADSCHDVNWAMMPSNGSDITISNSTIRAIGAWFQNADTVSAYGIFDNSSYTDFTTPLSDRNLHLINSTVQTWSLYVFDISHLNIDSCQLGEVGCENRSSALGENFLLDGSGGYFWATDTGAVFASGVTDYSTARAERNGIFYLQYSWLLFAPPSAINNGLIICVQNNLVQDPVAYDNGVAWLTTILSQDTAHVDSLIPLPGKAWIDQGPQGGWLFFESYSLYYQLPGDSTWRPIVTDSVNEIRGSNLAMWNTAGIPTGYYLLKLSVKDTYGDSVYALKPITLLPATVNGIQQNSTSNFSATVFPNPSNGAFVFEVYSPDNNGVKIELQNALGQRVFSHEVQTVSGRNVIQVNEQVLASGIYFYSVYCGGEVLEGKVVVK